MTKKYNYTKKTGRPAKFKTPEELQIKVNEYFDTFPASPTLAGLALYLGFESWQSINDYAKRDKFSYVISCARLKIIDFLENSAMRDKGSPQGVIHRLKVMKYDAPQQISGVGGVPLQIVVLDGFGKKKK